MEKMRRKSGRSKKALVLPLVVVMVIILFVIGLALIRLGLSARLQAVRSVSEISARCAADAGLTKAMHQMLSKLINEDPWDNSNLPEEAAVPLPNSYSNYSFDITGDPNNGFIVASLGRSGFAEKVVYGKLIVKSLWFGIGIREFLDVKVGVSFDTMPSGENMTIQTNSTAEGAIGLKNAVVFPGDVVVGPGGDPETVITLYKDAKITGGAYVASEELYFPPVTPPNDLLVMPTEIKLHNETKDIYPAENGIYPRIYLKTTSELRIVGNVVLYVTGDLIIENGCKITITDGSSLVLYLDGKLDAKYGSAIENANNDALSLLIYGTSNCASIELFTSSDFYGAIYAPEAHIIMHNSADLYGAFISRSMEIKNTGEFVFHYDSALADVGINDETAYFALERWWEE